MKEIPIIFSTDTVQAILDGGKTQTRRLIKPQPIFEGGVWQWDPTRYDHSIWEDGENPLIGDFGAWRKAMCPYGQVGDKIWVRENFCYIQGGGLIHDFGIKYQTDQTINWWKDNEGLMNYPINEKNRPSIHLPKKFSRIWLEITEVRVERVQEISEEDCKAEGCISDAVIVQEEGGLDYTGLYARDRFPQLWDSINGKRGDWKSNPWVWVISFKRIE